MQKINWKNPKVELPAANEGIESVRCLALCKSTNDYCDTGCRIWTGLVDIFFNPSIGWMRCEDQKSTIYVLKWIYWEDVGGNEN